MCWNNRLNDRNSVASFREREQVRWHATLNQDVGFEPGESADRIEGRAKERTVVEQKQRMGPEMADVDSVATLQEWERRMAHGQKLNWRHRIASELAIVCQNDLEQDA